MTYQVGDMKVEVGGRVADSSVINAHTDGDTWVYFPDANVLSLGDTFTNRNYPNIDCAQRRQHRGHGARRPTGYLKAGERRRRRSCRATVPVADQGRRCGNSATCWLRPATG